MTVLGKYELHEEIGRGGFATVHRATHTLLESEAAVKVLDQKRLTQPQARQRMEREARIAAGLSHPHLIKIFDLIQEGETLAIAMEYLRGVDIYDPTTGEIRSSSVDDIACWFIDTNYNEESFFVRHAYFSGMDSPYEKLQRALRAEIHEEAWQSLYRTVSRPFPRPQSGKIAVKVINHYGDEVLKIYDVSQNPGN